MRLVFTTILLSYLITLFGQEPCIRSPSSPFTDDAYVKFIHPSTSDDFPQIDGTVLINGNNYPNVTTFVLTSSQYARIKFTNLTGTNECPILITNQNGLVVTFTGSVFDDDNKQNTFEIKDCSHVEISGQGIRGEDNLGIRIADAVFNPNNSENEGERQNGIYIHGNSHDINIHHLDIQNPTGFAGIMVKNSPICKGALYTCDDYQYLSGIKIHDNFIHKILNGEGIYIGDSFFLGYPENFDSNSLPCSDSDGNYFLYPQPITGVEVYNNKIVNTGYDGIQLGSAISGSSIYHNVISNYGQMNNEGSHSNGIQIGSGSQGLDCYGNFIFQNRKPEYGHGIFCQGAGNNCISNNIIINPVESGIYLNENTSYNPEPTGHDIPCNDLLETDVRGSSILHNTIIYSKNHGIRVVTPVNSNGSLNDVIVEANLFIYEDDATMQADGLPSCDATPSPFYGSQHFFCTRNLLVPNITDLSTVFSEGLSPQGLPYPNSLPRPIGEAVGFVPEHNYTPAPRCATGGEFNFYGALSPQNIHGLRTNNNHFFEMATSEKNIQNTNSAISYLKIIPTPLSTYATLYFEAFSRGYYQIDVININGQVMQSEKLFFKQGKGKYDFPETSFSNIGVYYVRLISPEGEQQMIRTVKI